MVIFGSYSTWCNKEKTVDTILAEVVGEAGPVLVPQKMKLNTSSSSCIDQCSQGVDTAGCPEIFWAVWAGCRASEL